MDVITGPSPDMIVGRCFALALLRSAKFAATAVPDTGEIRISTPGRSGNRRPEYKYLQNYLDEYFFRFNRRKSKSIGKKIMRIVEQVVKSFNIRNKDIPLDPDAGKAGCLHSTWPP